MRAPFNFSHFNSQLRRTVGYTYTGGADIGECLSCADRIQDGDFGSWLSEWTRLADRVYQSAMKSRSDYASVSARAAFLRASNYYRTAAFFLYSPQPDHKLLQLYGLHQDSFQKAVELMEVQPEPLNVPYENTQLPGYLYKPLQDDIARPTIIVNSGYDSTHQEQYFTTVIPALARGYNVVTFDGPGQGELLIKQHIGMRPDWEHVITPIVDYLLTRTDVVPNQIAVIGWSWGGYLVPRAAAHEQRLAAIVANPGQYEPLDRIKAIVPQVTHYIEQENDKALERIIQQMAQDKALAFTFKAKQFVHNISSTIELFKDWTKYTLADQAPLIRCPTLILDSENETYSKGQAKQLYDALRCPKEYHLFTNEEGAGEHCQTGALSAFTPVAFDWLKQHLPVPSRDRTTVY